MATSAINIAIENLFATGWAATTDIKYDNAPFTVPAVSWVSIECWDGVSSKASIGSGAQLRRSTGTVFVNIYTPINKGSRAARDLADSVQDIFRDKQVSGITFEEPDVRRIGEQYFSINGVQSTTQWYQMIVAIPYFHDIVV
jgi:hypothetical protein